MRRPAKCDLETKDRMATSMIQVRKKMMMTMRKLHAQYVRQQHGSSLAPRLLTLC
jgi:ABC-type microcin C transport system duplicated ATPase subunit YejF